MPDERDSFDWGGAGVNWKINGSETGERFSVVHHPIAPRTLVAPLHYHHNEDEYSFVLEGKLGRCWEKRPSRPAQGLGCSSPATSGIPSGMLGISIAGS
jgi:quercetin dioxygenase-like cupin family protein